MKTKNRFAILCAIPAAISGIPASAAVPDFLGGWQLEGPARSTIRKLRIRANGPGVSVRVFGRRGDWGVANARIYGNSPRADLYRTADLLTVRFSRPFARTRLLVRRLGPNRLRVEILSRVRPGRGASNFHRFLTFRRIGPGPGAGPGPRPGPKPRPLADCKTFGPFTARVMTGGDGLQRLVLGKAGGESIMYQNNRSEAERMARIVRFYRLNRYCTIPGANPPMLVWLSNGRVPAGATAGERCRSIHSPSLRVQRDGAGSILADRQRRLFTFAGDRGAAFRARAAIRRYNLRFICFTYRAPHPPVIYFRQ